MLAKAECTQPPSPHKTFSSTLSLPCTWPLLGHTAGLLVAITLIKIGNLPQPQVLTKAGRQPFHRQEN